MKAWFRDGEGVFIIRYCIFDFDGTIVNSIDIIVQAYNRLAWKYQAKKIEPDDVDYMTGLSIRERCKYLNFKLYKFPFMALDIYKLYYKCITELRFFPGIRELLDELNACGFEVVNILTNSASNIRDFLQHHQIGFIKYIITSNKLFGKDKDIRRFLKEHKLKNTEVIYIGDEIRDIVASQKNNIKVIWVSWGYDLLDYAAKANPDFIAVERRDILEYVRI